MIAALLCLVMAVSGMNQLVNPGFETDKGWTLTGAAAYVTTTPHRGAQCAQLRTTATQNSQFNQNIGPMPVGATIEWEWWYRLVSGQGPGVKLHFQVDRGNGTFVAVNSVDPFLTTSGVWLQAAGTFVVQGSGDVKIRLTTDPPGFATGKTYLVDTTSVIEDKMKWEVLSGLIDRLKSINGGPTFHNDLSNRVYTRELWPDDAPDVKMPFVCVVEQPTTYPTWQRGVETDFQVFVRCFVEDTSSDHRDTSTMQALAELHDDVWNALMTDETLGGVAHDLQVQSSDVPPAPGRRWAGMEFDIAIKVYFQQSELSP